MSLKTAVNSLEVDVEYGLEKAIQKSENDLKATLFLENIKMNKIETGYKIRNIQLKII